jgi:hypothetical protein
MSATPDSAAGNNQATVVTTLQRVRGRCDVNGDGFDEIVTGAGPGGGPHINVWTLATGAVTNLYSFYTYDPLFGGGTFVGCGDLDGDGLGDVVTGPGTNGGPHVDGDGVAEIITGAGPFGGPHVRVFKLVGRTPVEIVSFFAYDPGFAGGIFVGGGDITGDGRAEIITGTYQLGGPVRVFSLEPGGITERGSFFAYFSGFSGPVHVGAADINGDGAAEIITGAGPGGGPHVRAISLVGGALVERASFYAYERLFCDMGLLVPGPIVCDGVFVGGGDVDADGVAEVVTGTNRDAGPLRVFKIGAGVVELTSFYPYFEAFRGPVHVAALTPDPESDPADMPRVPQHPAVARVDAVGCFERCVQTRMKRADHLPGRRERGPPI